MNWTVGKKITGGFLLVLVLVILMSGYSYWKIGEITSSYEEFDKLNIEKIEMAQGAAADIANEAVVMRRFNFVGDPADIAVYNDYKAKSNERLAWLEKNLRAPKALEQLSTMKQQKAAYEEIAELSMAAKQAGKLDEVASYMSQAGKPYKATMGATDGLVAATKEYIKQQQEKQSGDIRFSQLMLVVVNVIVIIVSMVIAFIVTRSISRPVREVAVTASQIAEGDLSVRQVEYNSDDEIGQLAKSFNKMAANLKNVIHQVAVSAEQVAASSEELTSSAEHSAHSVVQVAATISDVAAVAAAIRQMGIIDNTVTQSAEVVTKLGDRSDEIGQIVNTIASIAGQTNLLALNAAIEAARAGEQGRGFAVVAEEVRKLAEQSQDAAKQIAHLIHEIQAETGSAVNAMKNGTREVNVGADVVNSAGMAFKDISRLIGEVSGQVKDISNAIKEIANGSQSLATVIRDIEAVGQKTSSQTQTVSAATQEQAASMQQIASSSEALATLASELQESVAKFRL